MVSMGHSLELETDWQDLLMVTTEQSLISLRDSPGYQLTTALSCYPGTFAIGAGLIQGTGSAIGGLASQGGTAIGGTAAAVGQAIGGGPARALCFNGIYYVYC